MVAAFVFFPKLLNIHLKDIAVHLNVHCVVHLHVHCAVHVHVLCTVHLHLQFAVHLHLQFAVNFTRAVHTSDLVKVKDKSARAISISDLSNIPINPLNCDTFPLFRTPPST